MKNLNYLFFITVFFLLFTSCKTSKTAVKHNPNQQLINKYAKKLNVSATAITNTKLYAFIDNWYGTKYKYGGVSKQGVDCSGFCGILYKEVYHKTLPRSTSEIVKVIKRVKKAKLKQGDLVFFNIAKKKNSHVGIYLINHYFVHASTSHGVIISNLDNPYYQKAYSKGGSVK